MTTAIACAGTAVLTGSWSATVAVAAGGFLIDVDHVVDYVLLERNRRLTPDAFLRSYLEGRVQWAVLTLHSYELFAALGFVAWWTGSLWLTAYLWGATLHLALDLTFNGEVTPNSIVAFYSFTYRLAHGFDARRLLGRVDHEPAPAKFWAAFFSGGHMAQPPRAVAATAPALARTWPPSKPSC